MTEGELELAEPESVEIEMEMECGCTLVSELEKMGVPVSEQWGKEGAKSLPYLKEEIRSGESRLLRDEQNQRVIRHVREAVISVYYQEPHGETWKLVEDPPEFVGRVGSKRRDFAHSVGKKLRASESPNDGAERALREELGLTGSLNIKSIASETRENPSISFPGLVTRHENSLYGIWLTDKQYDPGGYQEVQPDKTTHFVWNRLSDLSRLPG